MKKFLLVMVLLIIPSPLLADKIRVHCQPRGMLFENLTDAEASVPYNPLPNEGIAVIDASEMPTYQYPEQLSCQNGKLVFDPNYKPPYAIKAEAKKEQLKQLRAELDAELDKAEPDVIAVARLQREIEKLKSGKNADETK